MDAVIYRFQYSLLGTTKESIVFDLNYIILINVTFSDKFMMKKKRIFLILFLNIYNDLCS